MDTNNSRMELLQDRAYPFSVPTFACFPPFWWKKKRTTVVELIRRSVLYLKTMAALPVVFAKIFVIYMANLRASREIWNQSTPKGKRQFLTRHQVFLSLLFTVRDRLRGRRSKGMEFGRETRQKSPFHSLSNAYHAGYVRYIDTNIRSVSSSTSGPWIYFAQI